MSEPGWIAFKEWASIVTALGEGRQILILRKGGISEKGKKFNIAHEKFFLFPTFEHQNPADLKPEGQEILKAVLGNQPRPGGLPIRYYCSVSDSFWIADEKTLGALDSFHLWSWECVKKRFEWGEEKGLFGIVVRVYARPDAVMLENLPRYGGCRSWVEFEKSLPTSPLDPVLDERTFQEKRDAIGKIASLESPAPPSSPA